MTATLTAEIEGESFTADLTAVDAVDAVLFYRALSEPLDIALGRMIAHAPADAGGWPMIERAIIKWLAIRQTGHPVDLPEILASVTFLPSAEPEGSADIAAPEVTDG